MCKLLYNYLNFKDGLIQDGDNGTFYYNQSKRFIKVESHTYTTTAIWDSDKLVSISDAREGDGGDCTLTYGTSCKKGYYPFISTLIGGRDIIFMAHPEIAGMKTCQLPSNIVWTEDGNSETSIYTYEFDKDGYISKITEEEDDLTFTYILTWE